MCFILVATMNRLDKEITGRRMVEVMTMMNKVSWFYWNRNTNLTSNEEVQFMTR